MRRPLCSADSGGRAGPPSVFVPRPSSPPPPPALAEVSSRPYQAVPGSSSIRCAKWSPDPPRPPPTPAVYPPPPHPIQCHGVAGASRNLLAVRNQLEGRKEWTLTAALKRLETDWTGARARGKTAHRARGGSVVVVCLFAKGETCGKSTNVGDLRTKNGDRETWTTCLRKRVYSLYTEAVYSWRSPKCTSVLCGLPWAWVLQGVFQAQVSHSQERRQSAEFCLLCKGFWFYHFIFLSYTYECIFFLS